MSGSSKLPGRPATPPGGRPDRREPTRSGGHRAPGPLLARAQGRADDTAPVATTPGSGRPPGPPRGSSTSTSSPTSRSTSGSPPGARRPRPTAGRATGLFTGLRQPIAAKLGLLTGALVLVLVISSALLLAQLRSTSDTYDGLLRGPVAESLQARQMQVEFKIQVQDWKDVLLRGFNPSDLTTYLGEFHAEDTVVDQLNATLIASTSASDPVRAAQLVKFQTAHSVLDGDYARALAVFEAAHGTNPTVPDRMVRGLDRPPTDLLDTVVTDLETSVSDAVARQAADNASRERAILVAGSGVLLMLIGVLVLAVMSIVRPIRRLTSEAFAVATQRLPGAINTIKTMDPGTEPPTLPPFVVATRDELADLGRALSQMQETALRLAVDQHRADRERAEMLVNLGRRNQNLLGRMLGYVTELERREQDPDVLSQLFALDHVTTRVRRNAESMLVLAGASQTRTWSRPVPVIDVVRAALSEIEDYIRVDLHHVEEGLIVGTAVADVVHLLAELMENATHFSPPTAQVMVIGQSVREGYRLRVVDQGVGMTQQELAEANGRIHRSDAGWSEAKLLGLYVVGRLARRRGIEVTLEPSAGRGTTASILLPAGVLGGRPPTPELLPSAGSSAVPAPTTPASGSPSGTSGSGLESRSEPGDARLIDLTDGSRSPASDPLVPTGHTSGPSGVASTGRTNGSPTGSSLGRSSGFEASTPRPVTYRTPPTDPTLLPPSPAVTPRALPPTSLPPSSLPPSSSLAPSPLASSSPAPAPVPGTAPRKPPEPDPPLGTAAVPRRVRGAQLPDLGPGDDPVLARPDDGPGAPDSLRWQLRSFQLDVQAARRAIAEARPATDRSKQPDQHRPEVES